MATLFSIIYIHRLNSRELNMFKKIFIVGILLIFSLFLSSCSPTPSKARGDGVVLLILGDSLSAGYQLENPSQTGWVGILNEKMKNDGFLDTNQVILNASVNGETTAGGLERLPGLLHTHRPNHLMIELGANDMLRRLPASETEKNLKKMISLAQSQGVKVALLTVEMPTIASFSGSGSFDTIQQTVARDRNIEQIRYPLSKIFGKPDMMLNDRLHPSQKAQPVLANRLDKPIRKFLAN